MKRKNIDYAWWGLASDVLGVPVFTVKAIKRLIKKEKIADSLEKIIEEAKEEAKIPPEKELSPVKIQLLRDSYEEQDDLFSVHFNSEAVHKLSFDEKIDYCLTKYKEESRKVSTATNSLILEENFFKGAKQTLFLYFFFHYYNINIKCEEPEEKKVLKQINQTIINNDYRTIKNKKITNRYSFDTDISGTESKLKKATEVSFLELFSNEAHYNAFTIFFKRNLYDSENGRLKDIEGKKSIISYILSQLIKQRIIKDIGGQKLLRAFQVSFGVKIPFSTFSGAKDYGERNPAAQYYLDLLMSKL